MSKYLKLLNWVSGGIITIFFLYGPMLSVQYECSLISKSSRIVTIVFLLYCLLSAIYWLINKKLNLVVHYSLILTIYIGLSFILFIIAASIG
ncbi:hypothetical protein [Paraclostridium sordellii]|uniref:hypothetical protein n=1 Tax=Paraclostridium sordellii TaxID=1505 RepID=UPI0022E84094|nr:hypothetical protein [Paeniclostridium sordellii]